jgi:hypothetical protein
MDELWHPIDLQLPEIIRSHTVIMLKRPTEFHLPKNERIPQVPGGWYSSPSKRKS